MKFLVQSLVVLGLLQGSLMTLPVKTLAETKPMNQTTTPCAGKLTQESIQTIVDQLAAARKQNDIEAMLKFVAPFVSSSVKVEKGDDSTTMRLEGWDAHREFLQDSIAKIKSREDIVDRVSIQMIHEQMAIVNVYRLSGIETQDAERLLISSHNVLRFGWVDGKPMITSMDIDGWLATRPPAE